MATDIAFVAGFLALLGSRVPPSLKIMLMSLAIADDVGAILLIDLFYSTDISYVALGFAAAGLGVTYIFNRIGVRQVSIYFLVGAGNWLAFLKSGVHSTVAGVLLGFLTPSEAWVGTPGFPKVLKYCYHASPRPREVLSCFRANLRETATQRIISYRAAKFHPEEKSC